jgi:ABC-2 type transport system permease protein
MIWTIASRELQTRGRSRGFLVITGILFAAVIGAAVGVSLFGGGDEAAEVTIGVTGPGVDYVEALEVGSSEIDATVEVLESAAEQALEDGEVDVLFDGSTLTWEGTPGLRLDSYIRGVAQQVQLAQRAEELDLSGAELSELLGPVEIDEVRLDGGDDNFGVRLATAGASGLAIFMLLQIWGSFIMMGVIEEKSSKVVEVLLSHVRPSTLLSGKIIGLGLLALAQMLVVVAGIVLGLSLVRDIEVPGSVWATVPLLLVTFLLGFGFYATAYAAVGSMVSRQEDATSAQLPAMLPLLAGYGIAFSSIDNPDNVAAVIGTFVPFTSPVLLPFRTALSDVPMWQAVVSLLILAGSIVVMVKVAGRIYRYSLLRTGTKVTFAEAWRNRNQTGF